MTMAINPESYSWIKLNSPSYETNFAGFKTSNSTLEILTVSNSQEDIKRIIIHPKSETTIHKINDNSHLLKNFLSYAEKNYKDKLNEKLCENIASILIDATLETILQNLSSIDKKTVDKRLNVFVKKETTYIVIPQLSGFILILELHNSDIIIVYYNHKLNTLQISYESLFPTGVYNSFSNPSPENESIKNFLSFINVFF